nr:nonstructural protein NSs [Kairi virus]CAA51850.1 NSs protein [Kairi virus]
MMSLLTPAVLLIQKPGMLRLSVDTPQGLIMTTYESSFLTERRLKILSQREVRQQLRLTLGAGRYLWLIRIFLRTGTCQFQMMVLPSTESVDILPGTCLTEYTLLENQRN